GSGGVGGDEDDSDEEVPAGQLTAGEWRDVDNWDFWLELFEDSDSDDDAESIAKGWRDYEHKWGYDTRERYGVVVTTPDGEPAVDAEVELVDDEGTVWRARTDNSGEAHLFAGLFGDETEGSPKIIARDADATAERTDIEPNQSEPIGLELDESQMPPAALDLMFVVDTTGSMGDEIRYLQAELGDTIERVEGEVEEDLSLRLSVNFYRDQDDDYIVRSYPFTDDVDQALGQLAEQSAAGGGDYPEAVDQALDDAIFEHEWRDEATARLLFLVLDAPPHDNQDSLQTLDNAIEKAAEKGVRVVPVSASGVDKPTEFLMRAFSIATGGTYVFLTNHSGIGNDHLEPTVGEYDVEYLNDLLVRLIAGWSKQP
ncbi:MAG: vWA domain-containing protein, partial [Persicimonas sp.]